MIAFRPADFSDDADRQFIVSNWSASYKKSHNAGLIHTDDYADIMHAQIGRCFFERPGARAIIAYDRKESSFWYGFIAGDTSEHTPVVFYVYVKEAYRRGGGGRLWEGPGLGRQLLDRLGADPARKFVYVCRTPVVLQLSDKIPRGHFNPLEARYPRDSRRRPL